MSARPTPAWMGGAAGAVAGHATAAQAIRGRSRRRRTPEKLVPPRAARAVSPNVPRSPLDDGLRHVRPRGDPYCPACPCGYALRPLELLFALGRLRVVEGR